MSRFDKIFAARETEEAQNKEKPPTGKNIGKEKNADRTAAEQTASPAAEPPAKSSDQTNNKQRGRPPAKRSDPDFVGLTTYIRRETHTRAKIALLQQGEGRELSELVEDLLRDWLGKNSQL